VKVDAFVDAQKADFRITTLCRVCRVSTSGFYDWVARVAAGPSDAERDDAQVLGRIRMAHRNSRGRDGQPRITAQLARDGVAVNHKRVERLMAANGIAGRCGRKKVRTTVRDPQAAPSADLVHRRFGQTELDAFWVGDATYIPTDEGWLYLATVIDACSRRLLGWSMTDHLRTELCLDALHAAVGARGRQALVEGVTFHSDHGCQPNTPPTPSATPAPSSASPRPWAPSAWDNSVAESFFGTLQLELLDEHRWDSRRQLASAIFDWIETPHQLLVSSGSLRGRGEGGDGVVVLAGGEAVVELADETVEQVPEGGGVAIASVSSLLVVGSTVGVMTDGGHGPDVAGGSDAVVLGSSRSDPVGLAR
jgi:transposase InsO family protein